MSQFTIPQNVSQSIARAKSLIKRDEAIRALDALIMALDLYEPSKLMGKARFEVEVLILECITELNRLPQIRALIESLGRSSKAQLTYTPGQEDKLKAILPIVRKALHETEVAKQNKDAEEKASRKGTLEQRGLAYLKAGDAPRGKSALRVLADEFGSQPGVLTQIGQWLLDAQLYFEAADFVEQAITEFPKESKAYAIATSCYLAVREFEKAEEVYLKALRQFGNHPKTLLNLAKLYVDWNKKEKAFETAQQALNLDPKNEEAKAIMDKCG